MKKILVILGPTATGKTDLAIHLAKQISGELVSCDSRQVYKGLDIGTGKNPGQKSKARLPDGQVKSQKEDGFWIVDGVKIWMYDISSPKKQYDVSQYIKDANEIIEDITARNKLPIIVGGTGLYLKGLLEGFSNFEIKPNLKLRKELEKSGVEELQKKLFSLSPINFQNLNNSEKNNKRRLIRKIEILSNSKNQKIIKQTKKTFNTLKIGLIAERGILNSRIDKRVFERINQGMIEEAEKLYGSGLSLNRMKSLGLEYGIMADFLDGKLNESQMINILKTKIHQYAKRQITWFKKEKNVNWFNISDIGWMRKVEKITLDWYNA